MSFLSGCRHRARSINIARTLSASALAASLLAACDRRADRSESSVHATRGADANDALAAADTDDFGAPLPIDARFSQRVVSLNPTATEVVFAIGAESHLVGRSRWDDFPEAAKRIMPLGDGIRPNVEMVLGARPTLVILYATAENRAAAEALRAAGVRTIALRVDHISQFLALTSRLGVALNARARATQVADSVRHTLDVVREAMRDVSPVTAVWPLWQSPLIVVGHGSYLDELLTIAGARNVFSDLEAPSPPVSIEEIVKRNPQVVVTSTKTAAALRASNGWQAVRAVRANRFVLDDPNVTGRPSVVLGMAAVSLARALHPERAGRLP